METNVEIIYSLFAYDCDQAFCAIDSTLNNQLSERGTKINGLHNGALMQSAHAVQKKIKIKTSRRDQLVRIMVNARVNAANNTKQSFIYC